MIRLGGLAFAVGFGATLGVAGGVTAMIVAAVAIAGSDPI